MRHGRAGSRIGVIPLLRKQRGAVAFEYLLVAGVLAVLGLLIYQGFQELVPEVVGVVCPSVDTAAPVAPTPGSCTTP